MKPSLRILSLIPFLGMAFFPATLKSQERELGRTFEWTSFRHVWIDGEQQVASLAVRGSASLSTQDDSQILRIHIKDAVWSGPEDQAVLLQAGGHNYVARGTTASFQGNGPVPPVLAELARDLFPLLGTIKPESDIQVVAGPARAAQPDPPTEDSSVGNGGSNASAESTAEATGPDTVTSARLVTRKLPESTVTALWSEGADRVWILGSDSAPDTALCLPLEGADVNSFFWEDRRDYFQRLSQGKKPELWDHPANWLRLR